jgi:hypothetical protein
MEGKCLGTERLGGYSSQSSGSLKHRNCGGTEQCSVVGLNNLNEFVDSRKNTFCVNGRKMYFHVEIKLKRQRSLNVIQSSRAIRRVSCQKSPTFQELPR